MNVANSVAPLPSPRHRLPENEVSGCSNSALMRGVHGASDPAADSAAATVRKLARPASRFSMISSARSVGSGRLSRSARLYYWKQWKQPRTRRRNLLALGADPGTVHMATRSRKGYWRMSQNEIVRFALNNRWLEEKGVPDMRAVWIVHHYGHDARV